MKTDVTRRQGVVLLGLVFLMTAVLALGVALLSLAGDSMLTRIHANNANRAYYLAESGAEYVRGLRKGNPSLRPAGSLTFADGDRVEYTTTSITGGVKVVSTGIVHPGSALETRRRVTFEMTDGLVGDDVLPIGFDVDGDGEFDHDLWTEEDVMASIVDTGPSGKRTAVDLKGTDGTIVLNWQDKPGIDLAQAWANNGNVLDYEAQVKVSPYDVGQQEAFSHHYMLGISFRLRYPASPESYGISVFHSRTHADNGHLEPPGLVPAWIPPAFEAAGLRGPGVHVVLWYRYPNGDIVPLQSTPIAADSGFVDVRDSGEMFLKPYTSLLVHMKEETDAQGVRQNRIEAFIQRQANYDLWGSVADMRWAGSTAFPSPVLWTQPGPTSQDVVDGTITSATFGTDRPSEISMHVFYDNEGAQKKFFQDFGMKMKGFTGHPQAASQLQY